MTLDEIKSKSKEELEQIVYSIHQSPYLNVYFSIKGQLDKLAKEIENAPITIEEPKLFDSFLKWTEKSLTATNNLQEILEKIDREVLLKAKEERLSATETSVESYISKNA